MILIAYLVMMNVDLPGRQIKLLAVNASAAYMQTDREFPTL